MPLHIPNMVELNSKLDNLRVQTTNKYIDLGKKLIGFSVNTINHFAHHLVVLKNKNIDGYVTLDSLFGPKIEKVAKNTRPSFRFGSTRGWTTSHFTNPEKYHPILLNRTKLDEKDILDLTKDIEMHVSLENSLNTPLPIKEDVLKVEVVSGTRPAKKVVKKVKNQVVKKKVTKVKRVKKGVFRRVED